MSVYTDLVEVAEDLHSYDETGKLWILKRGAIVNGKPCPIDLTLAYDEKCDTFVAEVKDGRTRVECNADRRIQAVQNVLDTYLDDRLALTQEAS